MGGGGWSRVEESVSRVEWVTLIAWLGDDGWLKVACGVDENGVCVSGRGDEMDSSLCQHSVNR